MFYRKKISLKKLLIISLLLTIAVGVSGSYAVLISKTSTINNKFQGAKVNIAVMENNKSHEDYKSYEEYYGVLSKKAQTIDKVVSIENKASDSYVRVRLIPVIKNEAGDILGKNVDITYTFEQGTHWKVDNGIYYYSGVLKKDEISQVLLKSVTLNEDLPQGYHLELNVLADAIAAKSSVLLQKAWGIDGFDDMQLIK